MHHLNPDKKHGEKARLEAYKNAMCCLDQILEARPLQNTISKTIQERQTKHTGGHCWKNNVLLRTPMYGKPVLADH